jgi:hypothetical protein
MKPLTIAAFLCVFTIQPSFAQFQIPKIILSYNGLTQHGKKNRDSVEEGLAHLGIPKFDTIDRNQLGNDTIDYTPCSILIWSSGDPTIDVVPDEPTGQAGLSTKEIFEIEKFLKAGESNCKKTLVMAGQNIAYEHGFLMPNGILIDTEFLQSCLHVNFVADSPDSGTYSGFIAGQQPAYWTYSDSLISSSPDVVKPSLKTPPVGPVVNGLVYTYSKHLLTPSDSGAGISFYNPSINIIFYAFDWADPIITKPGGFGDTTSGTTRILAAAIAFSRSHGEVCTESVRTAKAIEPDLELHAIVPNPAQTQAELLFTLPEHCSVTIRILDLLGRIIRTEFEQISMNAGTWSKILDLTNIPSGNYTCELVANSASSGTSAVTENFIIQ